MKIKYLKEKYKYISVPNMNYKNIRTIRIYTIHFLREIISKERHQIPHY